MTRTAASVAAQPHERLRPLPLESLPDLDEAGPLEHLEVAVQVAVGQGAEAPEVREEEPGPLTAADLTQVIKERNLKAEPLRQGGGSLFGTLQGTAEERRNRAGREPFRKPERFLAALPVQVHLRCPSGYPFTNPVIVTMTYKKKSGQRLMARIAAARFSIATASLSRLVARYKLAKF